MVLWLIYYADVFGALSRKAKESKARHKLLALIVNYERNCRLANTCKLVFKNVLIAGTTATAVYLCSGRHAHATSSRRHGFEEASVTSVHLFFATVALLNKPGKLGQNAVVF